MLTAPAYVSSRVGEALEVCRACGLELDDWQQLVLEHALGVDVAGKWAAFEVGLVVPRQNGKGGILEARELAGLFVFGERLVLHSAHEFATSMEAFMRMEALLEEGGLIGELRPRSGVSRSHGMEGFTLRNGQRLRYRTRTKGGGRGFTVDGALILDEAMELQEAFVGALLPTLSGRSMSGNPQVFYAGSAVDQFVHDNGVVLARVRERGLAGDDPSLVYAEWSGADGDVLAAQVDEAMASDQARWAQANPALGIRISAEHVEKELRSMALRTFAVERLNVGDWPATDGSSWIIDPVAWERLTDRESAMQDPVCLAFDLSPDRSTATIAAAGRRPDGLSHLEIVDRRPGTGWVGQRMVELVKRHDPAVVITDGAGPAASLVEEIEFQTDRDVKMVTASEYAQACGTLVDVVTEEKVRHLGQAELAAALKGAAQRPLGDAWAWSRKNSSQDITPLVAGTLALWAAVGEREEVVLFSF